MSKLLRSSVEISHVQQQASLVAAVRHLTTTSHKCIRVPQRMYLFLKITTIHKTPSQLGGDEIWAVDCQENQ